MLKKKKLVIIGHFGGNENFLDGQTVKTKILYDELSKDMDWKIIKVDTYYKSKKPVKLLLCTIKALFSSKYVIVLLSGNGMKFYFPILYFFVKTFHTRVFHDVIGGNLDTYVKKIPKFKKYLNSFRINWVETDGLKQKLEAQGIHNCKVIPNFKRLNCIASHQLSLPDMQIYRFCTFSRVMKEKGIEDAVKAIRAINKENQKMICTLDIYGSVDGAYKEQFDTIIARFSPEIKYCGKVSYEKSVETIKNYYALLFPTFWKGEGFPGTIVDAFYAGLPVIATDWNCNKEIVENGKNGILYPNNQISNLKEAIEWLIENKSEMIRFKRNCVNSAKKYQPDKYIKNIIAEISKD